MWWAATTRKDGRGCASTKRIAGERLWKSRSVENQNQVFHGAWKSRKRRGIPTFPQPQRRSLNLKPDISCALKSGHFNLLPTRHGARLSARKGGQKKRHRLATNCDWADGTPILEYSKGSMRTGAVAYILGPHRA